MTPWLAGVERIGAYRLIRLLGQGGMGAVLEAAHERTGQRVAVKILLPQFSQHAEVIARFYNEGHAMRLLDHPGVVRVFEVSELTDGLAYLVMEFLTGETLTRRLGSGPVAGAIGYAGAIAETLVHAHAHGVVHRDLKPDNIMLISDLGTERVKLLDFGIAKIADGALLTPGMHAVRTRTGTVMGTPAYMSPEQCLGERSIGAKTDVYALGVMLYQLLAGRPPFSSGSIGEILRMQINDMPRPLSQLVPTVAAPLEALVRSMLHKSPQRRPEMAEVGAQLWALESSGPTVPGGRPTGHSTPPVAARPARRVAPVLLLAIAGGAGLGGAIGWQLRRASPAPASKVMTVSAPTRAPASPPVAAAAPSPGEPKTVLWFVKSDPPGADVVRLSDGAVLGKTPWYTDQTSGAGSVAFELRRSGYTSQRVVLDLAHNSIDRVKLERKATRSRSHDEDELQVKPLQ